jgi:hypothetical protein
MTAWWALGLALAAVTACGAQTRDVPTIGYQPNAPPPVRDCQADRVMTGRAHVELFAFGRIVVVPAGIGIARGRRDGAYVRGGRCRARLWTHEPTGVIELSRSGLRLGDLFAVWQRRFGHAAMLSFRAEVRVWLDGTQWRASPASAPLADGGQIVVQAGRPLAPVHGAYTFPP